MPVLNIDIDQHRHHAALTLAARPGWTWSAFQGAITM